MKNEILAVSIPGVTQIAETTSLLEEVNRHDGTGCSIDPEDDFRRIGEFNSEVETRAGLFLGKVIDAVHPIPTRCLDEPDCSSYHLRTSL